MAVDRQFMTEGLKVREENVSVILSGLLEERGVPNVSLLQVTKVPDIYLVWSGTRVIIETKEEGQRSELTKQLAGRISEGLCEVAVGLEYPTSLVKGTLVAPSTSDIRKTLQKVTFISRAISQGGTDPRLLFEETEVRLSGLPELLAQAASEALPDADLEEAVARIKAAVEGFVSGSSTLPGVVSTAEKMRSVLELGP